MLFDFSCFELVVRYWWHVSRTKLLVSLRGGEREDTIGKFFPLIVVDKSVFRPSSRSSATEPGLNGHDQTQLLLVRMAFD